MPAELIPVSERDEVIFTLWEGGKGLSTIAREMGISRMEVEQALDRVLPVLSQVTNARAYKRHLFLMEDLNTEFYAIAKSAKSDLRDRYDAAHLCARLNERICAMNGWTSVNIRMDPIAAQAAEQPTSYQKITDVLMNLKYGGRPSDGDGAALAPPSAPSGADDPDRATGTNRERDKGAT